MKNNSLNTLMKGFQTIKLNIQTWIVACTQPLRNFAEHDENTSLINLHNFLHNKKLTITSKTAQKKRPHGIIQMEHHTPMKKSF